MFIRAGDLGWSLLTGGRCSEVAVLTVVTFWSRIITKLSSYLQVGKKKQFRIKFNLIKNKSLQVKTPPIWVLKTGMQNKIHK
jgi:hypothetical protein